jgi:hypothetical protein
MNEPSHDEPSSPVPEEIPVKGPHAQRRFLQQLAAVQRVLRSSSTAGVLPAQAFYKGNGRTPMFVLQGLSRVYENLGADKKLFAAVKLEAKVIEDAFGAVDFWWVVAGKARDWSLPAGVVRAAQDRHLTACGRAWTWLEARGWLAHRYQEKGAELTARTLARKLKKVEWRSPRKESRALLKWLIAELSSVHAKVQKLDMSDIEGGLHEARRAVRWFSIYASAMEGAIVLDSEAAAPQGWERYLTKEIVESPFNRLPAAEPEDEPVSLPAPLFYALSYAIDRLGAVKDRAQWTETMQHLLHETGEKTDKPLSELMGEIHLETADAARLGGEIVAQVFEQDRLLPRLIDALEAQR